jgi:hypothetical protein
VPLRQAPITATVTPRLIAAFHRTVSPERWRTYKFASGFKDQVAVELYLWNAAIGQSFHFPLQTVEVALRNVTHEALTALYGVNWCFDNACRNMLGQRLVDDLVKAEQRYHNKYQTTPSATQLLASLSLGFWVSLLRKPYHTAVWGTQTASAFPHLAVGETIQDVSAIGTAIQDLRNRIFHQEPLIGHNLSQDFGNISKMLNWICPDTRDWMRQHSSVQKVIRERPR